MTAEEREEARERCGCHWCSRGIPHPSTEAHGEFHRLGDRLLVAESLDPAHRVERHACTTCGHIVEGASYE